MSIFWTILIIGFVIVEASTVQLVCIWFAGGALASLICTLLGFGIWVQIITFVLVSAILLMATRPLVKKLKTKTDLKTNTEALIGQKAVVMEDISNITSTGAVKFHDVTWSARSSDESDIKKGTTVVVEEIKGVKLIVSEIEEE